MRRLDYGWVILATGFVVLFFSSGSRFALGLMLKPMTDDLGWSRSSLSLPVTAFMVVSALAMPLVGRLVDRHNPRLIIAGAALAASVGIGLMGRVTAQWQVFMLYGLVYALGHAGTSVAPVGVMISRWFVRRRGIANSAAISGNAIGQLVIITLLASALTSLGWRTSFMVLGAANAAVVVPLVLAGVRPRVAEDPQADGMAVEGMAGNSSASLTGEQHAGTSHTLMPLSAIMASRQLWLLVVVYAVCGFQDFFVALHVVAFAQDQGVGSLLAGNILALMGLMGLMGVLASGVLADAFGAARPTALCFLIRIGIFTSVIYFQGTIGVAAFALLYGFTFLITAPLTVVFAGNIFGPTRLGTVSGLISMVHQIAGGLGAFAGAAIFDQWGSYDRAFLLMLGLALIGAATTLLVREKPLTLATARA